MFQQGQTHHAGPFSPLMTRNHDMSNSQYRSPMHITNMKNVTLDHKYSRFMSPQHQTFSGNISRVNFKGRTRSTLMQPPEITAYHKTIQRGHGNNHFSPQPGVPEMGASSRMISSNLGYNKKNSTLKLMPQFNEAFVKE